MEDKQRIKDLEGQVAELGRKVEGLEAIMGRITDSLADSVTLIDNLQQSTTDTEERLIEALNQTKLALEGKENDLDERVDKAIRRIVETGRTRIKVIPR